MKPFRLVFILLLFLNKVDAQRVNTDSLWQIVDNTKNDSLRFHCLQILNYHYLNTEIDSNFSYSKRLIKVCEKVNTPKYLAYGILQSTYAYYRIGDYKKVQEGITKASEIANKNADQEILARIENFKYLIESDPNKKIEHLRKAILLKKAFTVYDQFSTTIKGNISQAFLEINQVDSAFFYAQKMYESAIKTNDTLSSHVTAAMGNVYLKMNQPEIAYAFFKKGVKGAMVGNKIGDLVRAYIPLANYYEKLNQMDSALFYWKKPFEFGPNEVLKAKLNASKKIYEYYYKSGKNDSAAKYMNFYIKANDSLNSANKITQLQVAKFEDELKEREQAKAAESEKEQRNHNLQLAITAIVIISAIILFLLLSRSILVSHKVVAFLSVIVLLVVFEFINLLIHPFLEKITHHSPVLMLLALVAIAALIVPLHHRLEHWTTKILVEKNKAIRLAQAKKTIEELEKDSPQT